MDIEQNTASKTVEEGNRTRYGLKQGIKKIKAVSFKTDTGA